MKVTVGNKIYDGHKEPVMVILTKGEIKQISNMASGCTRYCQYPDSLNQEEIKVWMKEEK